MAPADPRVSKAFNAMKYLGIRPETVKPVLKKLLKLYDGKWELIEENNYSTLADAIFEFADDEGKEGEKKDALEYDKTELPRKNPHLGEQDDQVSPTMGTEFDSRSHHTPVHCKGKDPISSCLVTGSKKLSSERTFSALNSNLAVDRQSSVDTQTQKMSVTENEDLVKPKINHPIKDSPQHFQPASTVNTGSLAGLLSENNSSKHPGTQLADKSRKGDVSTCEHRESYGSSFDIASSSFGEVKILLNCDGALGQPNFHAPKLHSVLKFLENKYVRSYKIVRPEFSVTKLLKEFCESYLELGCNSKSRSTDDYPSYNVGSKTNRESPGVGKKEKGGSSAKQYKASESTGTLHLVAAQKLLHGHRKKGSFHEVDDITKGTEKVRISLLDEVGNEQLPCFVYVPQNVIFQSAYVHVSLARIPDEDCCSSCTGDCLSSAIPCACARDTGGEFAYTPQGLLTEEFLQACISMNHDPQKHYQFHCQDCPLERAKNAYNPEACKGHLVRRFIKECWRKCGCSMQCGNRLVQRGISCNLQVFLTNGCKGWGLRTLEGLPKGAFVCEYVGEILTNMELYERNNERNGNERHTYPVLLDADWGSEQVLKDEDALCLDATNYGNVARFINHRCFDANLLGIPVEVETPDHHYYHLAFFTKRKVDAFEELTWDYGIDFSDHNHPIEAFHCHCESAFCRDTRRKGITAGSCTADDR